MTSTFIRKCQIKFFVLRLHVNYRDLMPPGQKAKCQSGSKTTTERNLREDIMLTVRYLNDLEITFPLPLPERSINFLKT